MAWLHAKDKRAVQAIYLQYRDALFGIVFRIVKQESIAEDVLQDALVKIWRNGPSYDAKKGRLFTWLLNICRNAAIDKVRSKAFQRGQNIQDVEHIVSREKDSPSYQLNTDQIGLKDWVAKLEPKYREVIEVVYLQEHSHREAAKKLGIPLGTLKTRVRDAIKALRSET